MNDLPRNIGHSMQEVGALLAAKATPRPTTVQISWSSARSSLRLSYMAEVAEHLGGVGTRLDFDQEGSIVRVSPTRPSGKSLTSICATSDKATVDFQSSTSALSITGHDVGMTMLDAMLTTADDRPCVIFKLPSNLKTPEAAPLHPFATMTPEAILSHLRADLVEAEKHGLSEWEIEAGTLYAAVAVTVKRRIG